METKLRDILIHLLIEQITLYQPEYGFKVLEEDEEVGIVLYLDGMEEVRLYVVDDMLLRFEPESPLVSAWTVDVQRVPSWAGIYYLLVSAEAC